MAQERQAVRIEWHDRETKAQLRARIWRNIVAAALVFERELKRVVGRSGGGSKKRTRSRPGEPPRKQTGFGQRSIATKLDRARHQARVGIFGNAIYMMFLEFGTRFILKRPWYIVTLKAMQRRLAKIVATGKDPEGGTAAGRQAVHE